MVAWVVASDASDRDPRHSKFPAGMLSVISCQIDLRRAAPAIVSSQRRAAHSRTAARRQTSLPYLSAAVFHIW